MALSIRHSKREREAILYAKMVDWEWQETKRTRHRKEEAKRRVRKLRSKDARLNQAAAL